MLRGATVKEVANYLHISYKTANTHIDHIKQKLGCKKKSDLIEKSLTLGLLNVIPKKIFDPQVSIPIN